MGNRIIDCFETRENNTEEQQTKNLQCWSRRDCKKAKAMVTAPRKNQSLASKIWVRKEEA
jgi:hypothetical protein